MYKVLIFFLLFVHLSIAGLADAPQIQSRYILPDKIRIPAINITASVESVGFGSDGGMDVPASPDQVAWFQAGTLPGAPGNAVIAGHLDSTTGPAVFWDLHKLKPGDTVDIEQSNGHKLTFVVSEVVTYKTDDAPLERIFGITGDRNLNLITCGGFFDQSTRSYDERVVVYTKLRTGMLAEDQLRLLGNPLSLQVTRNGYTAQYFEKAVIEDHVGEPGINEDSLMRYQYGLLVDQLHEAQLGLPIGGDRSDTTYATLHERAAEAQRVVPPDGYTGSIYEYPDGSVFVPFSADLSPAPGHTILPQFWTYLNQPAYFPGGWLNEVGLPITEPFEAKVTKQLPDGSVERTIIIQAFQRTILTYDPANTLDWQVERANIGTDYYVKAGLR